MSNLKSEYQLSPPDTSIYRLSICGEHHEITRKNVEKYIPKSKLAQLLKRTNLKSQSDARIYIDQNPKYFVPLLDCVKNKW